MHHDDTCCVNHHTNDGFCINADPICFPKCWSCLLVLKDYQGGKTLERGHLKRQDDECTVSVHFNTTTPSLSHGDEDFNLWSNLFQGGGGDAEHPMDITMSRAPLSRDTCNVYFVHIKVNHLLYMCLLDPFLDGILLDPPLVCMHRFEQSFTCDEKCTHKSTTTPSPREEWKRRKKRTRRRGMKAMALPFLTQAALPLLLPDNPQCFMP
jgi:hypothetical protein